ncbi:MAG TPA: methyl-accepting chemotaxis protein [Spirochaetota bacterium]|nr:hypothetical protein [Spirochaetota bacterium]HQO38852.1 methyl-accepting chemotaxis protein [Spirochaetota bacterium]
MDRIEIERVINRARFIFFAFFMLSGLAAVKTGSVPAVYISILSVAGSYLLVTLVNAWYISKSNITTLLIYTTTTLEIFFIFFVKYSFHNDPYNGYAMSIKEPSTFILYLVFAIICGLRYDKKLNIYFGVLSIASYILLIFLGVSHGGMVFSKDPATVFDNKTLRMAQELPKIMFMAGTSYFLYIMASFTNRNVRQLEQARTESDETLQRTGAAVTGMNEQIGRISSSSKKISSACREISVRNSEHDGSIKEISETVDQFTSSVHSNTLQASESSRTLASLNTVIAGKKVLAENLSASMNRISAHSHEISTITGVINDISFQTNLLALNAAIEAARAGDAGRGFMVVASEVKNLSQKTTESSKRIREIIESNTADVDSGASLVLEVSEFFADLITDMNEIVTAITRISDESAEQMNGIKTIGHAVENLVHTGSVFSSAIKELSGSSDELNGIINSLEQLARDLGRK